MRFGKLKLLTSAQKTVSITVNGIESEEVAMLLGGAGEAFFLRQVLKEEIESEGLVHEVSSTHAQVGRAVTSRSKTGGTKSGSAEWDNQQDDLNQPKLLLNNQESRTGKDKYSGSKSAAGDIEIHDQEDPTVGGYFLQDLDQAKKKRKTCSSPRSAHYAMNDFNSEEDEADSFGDIPEEQRKGLWKSIFGYFRGPTRKASDVGMSKSAKGGYIEEEEIRPAINDEFDIRVLDEGEQDDDYGSRGQSEGEE